MAVYFSNEAYFKKALELAETRPMSSISLNDAFLQLVNGSSYAQLENLMELVHEKAPGYSTEEIYHFTQNHSADIEIQDCILECAYELLQEHKTLGNELVPNTSINTSDWIAHSLLEAKACGILASSLGLDKEKVMKLGMLHDIGRRVTHTFEHTVRGFEILVDRGMDSEALGCLTHSFINGGRCASNEKAEPGFKVSDDGRPCWEQNFEKDHITRFLEAYEYTPYDMVLNLADLMATSKDIVSPAERIKDIATRRTIDPVNRGYFLAELINLCRIWLEPAEPVRFTIVSTLEGIELLFEEVSSQFWSKYLLIQK